MLRLARKVQESVVINANGSKDKPLVIKVLDMLPSGVGLGFEGDGYDIVRSELYRFKGDKNVSGRK